MDKNNTERETETFIDNDECAIMKKNKTQCAFLAIVSELKSILEH